MMSDIPMSEEELILTVVWLILAVLITAYVLILRSDKAKKDRPDPDDEIQWINTPGPIEKQKKRRWMCPPPPRKKSQ